LAREFAESLEGADTIYLAPIYGAGEAPIDGVSERSIGKPLAAAGKNVQYVRDVRDLRTLLQSEAPSGSLVLMLGAGDITKVSAQLAADLRQTAPA
jgi:UDP-N-acetylmuramate--alanine ligase